MGTLVLGLMGSALASPGGINGFSGNPATQAGFTCNICHSGGVAPEVSLIGPMIVTPGSTNTYTLLIRGGQEIAGGLDVSVTDGELSTPDPETYINNGEVTHSFPRTADAMGLVAWDFDWTAPLSAGSVTMYGAGNSVNLADGTIGDQADNDILAITVEEAMASTPGETSGLGRAPLLVTARDSATGIFSIDFDTGCDTTDNSVYFGRLADVSTYGYSGEVCNLGTGGAADLDLPGESLFFIVVGDNDAAEGSYGLSSVSVERSASGSCGLPQDLSNTCLQP